jgi:hypothetical protein
VVTFGIQHLPNAEARNTRSYRGLSPCRWSRTRLSRSSVSALVAEEKPGLRPPRPGFLRTVIEHHSLFRSIASELKCLSHNPTELARLVVREPPGLNLELGLTVGGAVVFRRGLPLTRCTRSGRPPFLKCLGNLTDCVLYHVGRGIAAEGKGERYQDRARTEV